MKKQRLLSRFLLPTIIVLLLLPPLSCLIFKKAAQQYAYSESIRQLQSLQKNILPLMKKSFQNQEQNIGIDISDQVQNFLSKAGQIVHRMGGSAQMMILGSDMQLIYPREEQERESAVPFAKELVSYLQEENISEKEKNAFHYKNYLIYLYEIPTPSVQIRYLILYCSTSQINTWVNQTSILVLAISSVFVLIVIVVLWLTANSIIRPLHWLCQRAYEIGTGDFSEIQTPFSLKELEELRLAMNEMSNQLTRSDQVQKDFFQNVSHELRNPLMSISGYAQGIEAGVFPSSKEAAHTILEESIRLTELVNSLLTLSRMESGQTIPQLSSVLIAEAIEDCLDRVHGLALKNNVAFSVAAFSRKLTVKGEEELIGKVMYNLMTNAIRYAMTTVTIEVTEEKNKVIISVSDDGKGIAPKDLPHLFERCYKGEGGHFGLGLSIASTAAAAMGGELTAANRQDGGAIFTLILQRM